MIVVFDASALIFLFERNANPPLDPDTRKPVDRCADRIKHLIATLQQEKAKIIVPTPALGEILVRAGNAAPEWLRILSRSAHFRIAAFDERAAVEFAAAQASRMSGKGKSTGVSRAKAKFDDQIVAIAAVEGADTIYSDDGDIRKLAGSRFEVKGIADLALPPEDPQLRLELDLSAEEDDATGEDGDDAEA